MMRSLAETLIAEELRGGNGAELKSLAAFRACEKLRRPLSTLAGSAGFQALLSRALVLARAEAPLLAEVEIKADGTLQYSAELEAKLASDEAGRAAAAVLGQLMGLLATFIGEGLTLRLAHDVWPKAAFKAPKSGGKQP
jgi:hypothetical protein